MRFFHFKSLFPPGSFVPRDRLEGRAPRGIRLLPNFVTPQELEELTAWIANNVAWSCGSYQGNRRETYDGEPNRRLPAWGQALGMRMREAGIFDGDPDHLHLISYQAGQGIARHIDRNCLGEVVAGLTLGSSRVFEFGPEGKEASARLLLMPGDLYAFSGPARHRLEHWVPFAKEDHFGGRVYPRTEGWSATWRRIDRNAACDPEVVPNFAGAIAGGAPRNAKYL